MSEVVLLVDKVSKTYYSKSCRRAKALGMRQRADVLARSGIRAVNNAYLEVYEGEIFGLLGPNGAGKSTLLKVICGLITATSGAVYINNKKISLSTPESRRDMGALIEYPAFFQNMSALDNLKMLAAAQGGITVDRIIDMAKIFGIDDRLKDKISTYSMGMRQKIGVIQALMHKPKLLILDEPTNGLDPKWIIEMREILKTLAQQYNMTIIISSHILSEMQELCDRVAIIDRGEIMAVGSIKEMTEVIDDGKEELELQVDNIGMAVEVLQRYGLEYTFDNDTLTVKLAHDMVSVITKELVFAGVMLNGVNIKKKKLEDIFRMITSNRGVDDDKKTLLKELVKGGRDHE